ERPNLLTIDAERAYNCAFLEHRNGQKRPRARHLDELNKSWVSLNVGLLVPNVGNVLQLLRRDDPRKRLIAAYRDQRFASPKLGPTLRSSNRGRNSKGASVIKQKISEFALTDACRVFQHFAEHWLKLARGTRDHPKNFRRCGLLLYACSHLLSSLLQPAAIAD